MTETELRKQLDKGELMRVYFLYGEEDFLVKTYADRICAACVPEEVRDMNFIKYPDAPPAAELSDYLAGMPVFSEYRCALIEDLDLSEMPEKEQKAYLALIKSVPEGSVLVISQRHTDPLDYDPKKGKALAKKLLSAAQSGGAACEFKFLTLPKAMGQIIRKVERAGCEISQENASFLAEECGMSLTALANEIDKLTAFRQSGEITREDIEALVPKRVDAGIYTLADAIFEGKTEKAFRIFDELIAQQFEPHRIFLTLSGHFVDLYRAKLARAAGVDYNEAARALGYYGRAFVMKNAYSKVSRLSQRYLGDCVNVLYKTNRLLNSSKADRRTLVESAIAEISMIEKQ